MNKTTRGFTLMEMTIVLVVVALVIAGILAARSIIRTSQLQAVMSELQMYSSAITNFKSKYLQLPGDFSEATEQWGAANCTSGGNTAGDSTGTQTCNGDGDNIIEFNSSRYEHLAAWRHLGISGFINQNFTGNLVTGGACNMEIKVGENAPGSKLDGAMWNLGSSVAGTAYTTGAGDQFIPMNVCTNNLVMHILWLGGSLQRDSGLAGGCAGSQTPLLTGAEAYEIDAKYDDKRAKFGSIRGQLNNSSTYESCEDDASPQGGYRTNATNRNCSLAFIIKP